MSPPCRVRDELLSVAGRLARNGETQLKQSPENPGRFTVETEHVVSICVVGDKLDESAKGDDGLIYSPGPP